MEINSETNDLLFSNFIILIIIPTFMIYLYNKEINLQLISNISFILAIFFLIKLFLFLDYQRLIMSIYSLDINTIAIGQSCLFFLIIFYFYSPFGNSLFFYSILIFIIFFIFLSSQKGVILLALILFCLFLQNLKYNRLIWFVLAFIILINLFINFGYRLHFVDRLLYIYNDLSTLERVDFFRLYLSIFFDNNFFFGRGLNDTFHPHNIILESLIINGPFFLFLIIFTIFKVFIESFVKIEDFYFIFFFQEIFYSMIYSSIYLTPLFWISLILFSLKKNNE